MAKTESTAVNQLISLVQTATPLKPDPSEDLMFKAPDKAAAKKFVAPRLTSTIPAIKTDVPALPRQRAPQGTQRGVPTVDDRPPAKPSVRMSTASQPFAMPAIQPWSSAEGTGEGDVITDVRNEALAKTVLPSTPAPVVDARATRPSLPPPHRPSAPPPVPRPSAVMAAPVVEAPKPLPSLPPPTPEMNAYPSAAPYMQHVAADMTSHQPWFDEQAPAAPVEEIEIDFGTDRVRAKATDWKTLIPKLIAPTLGLIIVGMFVGGFLAFDGQGGKKKSTAPAAALADTTTSKVAVKAEAPKPAAVVAPAIKANEPKPEAKVETKPEPKLEAKPAPKLEAKAAEPTTPPNLAPHATAPAIAKDVKAPAAPHARTAFVDIRLDSTPSGATVTLIDRGKSTFLGTTPISTAVDPSRQYDIVFSHASKPTQIEHLDPATTKRLAVVLGKTTRKAETAKKPEAPKAEVPKAEPKKVVEVKKTEAPKAEVPKTEPKSEPKKVETVADAPKDAKKAVVDPFDAPKAEAPKGEGVLMVSSKPPCEILIDGVATGLTTPQRAIKLTAGTHKVTLVNSAEKIKKTVTITVSADQPTKVIENFMK